MLRGSGGIHLSAAFVAAEVSDGVVPVTVVIRTAEGMVTGDLEIPEDRWNPWLFLEFLGEQDRGLPS